MALDPKFDAASEAAESWPNTVAMIAHLGPSGAVDPAYELLLPNPAHEVRYYLQDDFREHADVLDRMNAHLAAVSDGPVKWEHGRGLSAIVFVPRATLPHVWSSAHEAAKGIAGLTIDLLARPLEGITDPAEQWSLAKEILANRSEAIAISNDEVATWQERIRRERVMVNIQSPSEIEGQAPSAERPPALNDLP